MTGDTVGGVWTYAVELAAALGAHGIDVVLATMGCPMNQTQRVEARIVPNLTVIESSFRLEWMEDPWEDVHAAGEWLLELERALQPDVVHLNGFVHGALPWTAPVTVVGHSCVLSWWAAVLREDPPSEWEHYHSAVARGLAESDAVVAPSAAMLAALRKHYGPIPHGRVVPNGRSPRLFSPGVKKPLVLAAGRAWDKAKNIAALERVAPAIPWPVYVAGEDVDPSGRRVRCRGVRLLGRLGSTELAHWCSRAAIFAHPARYEPFGLSVLEAALSGCALVLGDVPSLREIWGDAALLVDPESDGALQRALHKLIRDQALRESLAARARERARAFTPEVMAAGYLAVYETAGKSHFRRVHSSGSGARAPAAGGAQTAEPHSVRRPLLV